MTEEGLASWQKAFERPAYVSEAYEEVYTIIAEVAAAWSARSAFTTELEFALRHLLAARDAYVRVMEGEA